MSTETEPKTYNEMLLIAKEIHPDAEVTMADGTWSIYTPIPEPEGFPEDLKGTPAEELWNEYDASYGTALDRWAWKNAGISSGSIYEMSVAYNQAVESYIPVEEVFAELGQSELYEKALAASNDTFVVELTEDERRTFMEIFDGNTHKVQQAIAEIIRKRKEQKEKVTTNAED